MSLFSNLLPALGAVGGGLIGGPAGAMIGGSIGQGLGGHFNQRSANRESRANQESTNRYFQESAAEGRNLYNPYINQGREAGNVANQRYGEMLNDPSGFVNQILSSYKPSEGYNFKEQHLRRGAANTAAAGGFSGTNYDAEQQSKLISALLSDDMQQYLTNVLGVHGGGLAGKELVAGRGFNASSNLGDYLGTNNANAAGLNFFGGNQRMADRGAYNNNMLQLGSQIGGQIAGIPGIWGNNNRNTGAGAPPGGGPVIGGYGGPRNPVPGAAWMRG